jgi:hypothetical protein
MYVMYFLFITNKSHYVHFYFMPVSNVFGLYAILFAPKRSIFF